jgi:hypothetical protein
VVEMKHVQLQVAGGAHVPEAVQQRHGVHASGHRHHHGALASVQQRVRVQRELHALRGGRQTVSGLKGTPPKPLERHASGLKMRRCPHEEAYLQHGAGGGARGGGLQRGARGANQL